jgi:AcrR family transcriptional regulator
VTSDPGTRERILEAASAQFAEHGFRQVTVRDICRAAEVNLAAVNYHFGDKAGLYREVMQAAIDAIRGTTEEARLLGAGRPAEERLQVFLRTFVRRLLASAQPRVQRLVQREMYEPSGLLDRLVAEAIRPRLEYVSQIVAELLHCPADDPRVLRCVFSIQSQAFATVPNPIGARLGFVPTLKDAEAIADHITRFSLGGIRVLAKPGRGKRAPRKADGLVDDCACSVTGLDYFFFGSTTFTSLSRTGSRS